MVIRNFTPHEVTLMPGEGKEEVRLPSCGSARCLVERRQIGEIDGITLNTSVFGEVTGLPEPQEGVFFLVSRIVAEAMAGSREDLVVVDETVRDDEGRIIGARALARI